MDQPQTPAQQESPEAIREDIEETKRQLQGDLETLQQRLSGNLSIDRIRATMRENPVPWLIVGTGASLAVLGAMMRQRRADMPPPPPKGTRRYAIAETARTAEREGLISPQARTIILSLLTAQGLRWLQRNLSRQAQHASAELAERAGPAIERARETTTAAAERTQERMRERAERMAARATPTGNGRGFSVRNWLPRR